MKFKSNLVINGEKFYSVMQIKEMLSYVASFDLELAHSYLDDPDADDASLRLGSHCLDSSNCIFSLVRRVDSYLC